MVTLPISLVVPTRDRALVLRRALESLMAYGSFPAQLIVIDASSDERTRTMLAELEAAFAGRTIVIWETAGAVGGAAQRNQGVARASQPFVCFIDDDIIFETDCLGVLCRTMREDVSIAGANAMIVNQKYHSPGRATRLVYRLLNGRTESSYAGRLLGPAVNVLPEDRAELPEVVPVEWLNLGCTLYRRDALPAPPFDGTFHGYSLMEDVTLSLRAARRGRLVNVRSARIYHDSQPGTHKSNVAGLSRMELVNRHYIMTRVLERRRPLDYVRLALWEAFQVSSSLQSAEGRSRFWPIVKGKLAAWSDIRGAAGTNNG